jgi:hypothetical protein
MKKWLFIFLIGATVISCRTRKNLSASGAYDRMSVQQLSDEFEDMREAWPSFSGKLNLHYKDKFSDLNLSARIKLVKDTAIWISVSPGLGIEALRALITPDSLMVLNRLEKTYFVGGFEKTEELFNTRLDFDMLQALFYGGALYPPNPQFFKKIENEQLVLRSHPEYPIQPKEGDTIFIELRSGLHNLNLDQQWIADLKNGRELNISNSEFEVFEGIHIATSSQTLFMDSIQTVQLDWVLSGMKKESAPNLPFKIPSKYVPMP